MNDILLEYYQGRSKELIKCEGYLREIIDLIHKDHAEYWNVLRDRHVCRNAEPCINLEKELAKFFNLKGLNITWKSGMCNAYTYGFSYLTSGSRNTALKNNNYVDFTINIVVYENNVYEANVNERELLALILHEIGHNFYYCPIHAAYDLVSAIVTFPIGLLVQLLSKIVNLGSDALSNAIKANVPIIYNTVELCNDTFNQFSSLFRGPVTAALNLLVSLMYMRIPSPMSILRYGDEKGADSFAARYGYGPELVTALEKLYVPENQLGTKIRSTMGPFGSVLEDLSLLMLSACGGILFDEHPSNNQRANSIRQKLERDLANGDYPPQAAKDIRAELDRMDKVKATMNDPKYGGNIKVRKAWYDTIDAVTKGHGDIREIFNFYFKSNQF